MNPYTSLATGAFAVVLVGTDARAQTMAPPTPGGADATAATSGIAADAPVRAAIGSRPHLPQLRQGETKCTCC